MRDRQVLILGERVRREAAELRQQRRSAPGADRARDDRDASEAGERAALEILRGDIFERLPAGDEIDAVADLGVAGDGADRGSRTSAPAARWCRLELGIGVERDDDLAAARAPARC